MTVNFGNAPNDSDDIQDLWYALQQIGFIDPETDRVAGANSDIDALITTSFERNSMYNGNLYSAGYLVEDVKDGESTFLFIENPANSGGLIDIDFLTIRSNGKVIITVTQDPTVDTPGTTTQIRNKRTGATDTTFATITEGGSYSGGDEEEDILSPAGEGEERVGGEATDRFALIDQGDSILIEVFNDAGRSVDQEIKIKFSEVSV